MVTGRVGGWLGAAILVPAMLIPSIASAASDGRISDTADRTAVTWATTFTGPDLQDVAPVAGTRRTVTLDGPSALGFFTSTDTGTSFRASPAPEMFIGEPDYGDTESALVNLAAGTLGEPTPLGLDDDQVADLLARARRELDPALALTGVELTTEGLLEAAQQLAPKASADPWNIDPSELVAATGKRLRPALAAFEVSPGDGSLSEQVRTALERAELPPRISTTQLSRLQSRAVIAHAAANYAGTGQLTVSSPRPISSLAQHRTLSVSTGVGPMHGHLVTVPLDDPAMELVSRRSTGWDRRATVLDAAAAHGLVVAVNGGFWTSGGDPDGLLVDRGDLQSDTTAGIHRARGVRTGFGITADGKPVVGRPDVGLFARSASGTTLIQGVNRSVGDNDIVLFTASGPPPTIPSGAQVWRVTPKTAAPDLTSPGTVDLTAQRAGADDRPSASSYLLVATNNRLFAAPEAIEVTTRAGWESLRTGMAAGPALVEQGTMLDARRWRAEGFAATHTDARHPRTAIGFDRFGTAFLLVIDGRQPGHSVGATHGETASIMAAFGVDDAVMLDGGGSTQLVIDGVLVNRPCCDASPRPVATVVGFIPG